MSLTSLLSNPATGYMANMFAGIFTGQAEKKAGRVNAADILTAAAWDIENEKATQLLAEGHLRRAFYIKREQYETRSTGAGLNFTGSVMDEYMAGHDRDIMAIETFLFEGKLKIARMQYQAQLDARQARMRGEFAASDSYARAAGHFVGLTRTPSFKDFSQSLLT